MHAHSPSVARRGGRAEEPVDACAAGLQNVQLMSEQAARTTSEQFNRPNRPAEHKDWPALLRMLERRGIKYAE